MINKIRKAQSDEKGAAIIFGFMFSLLALGLSFLIMITTVTSINVASVASVNKRLQLSSESAINTAVSLINSGYNFLQHNSLNRFKGYDSVGEGAAKVDNISWEWWVEPIDIDSTTKCTMGVSNDTHYCGYYVYAKSFLLNSESNASVTLRGRILPLASAGVTVNESRLVTYYPAGMAFFRHGLFGKESLSIGDGVLLGGYQSDAFGSLPTSDSSPFLISSGGQILLASSVDSSSIDTINLYKNESGIQGSCIIGIDACNTNSINIQKYNISLAGGDQFPQSRCASYDVLSITDIEPGVTCYDGNLSLLNNIVLGDSSNPSILIVNGDLTISPGATINTANNPNALQIFVNGNINITSSSDSPIGIAALIFSSGQVVITGDNSNGKVKIYGGLVGNEISVYTNVEVWQDNNTKYLKDPSNFPSYQISGMSVIESTRDEVPFSILGDIFGNKSDIDSSLKQVTANE